MLQPGGSLWDYLTMIVSLVGVSMPSFWLGLVLLSHVALHVSWIPMFGRNASIAGGLFTLLTQFKAGELITARATYCCPQPPSASV